MRNIYEGLKILILYSDQICAEHDIIYAAPNCGLGVMEPKHAKLLEEFGWFWDDESGGWAIHV